MTDHGADEPNTESDGGVEAVDHDGRTVDTDQVADDVGAVGAYLRGVAMGAADAVPGVSGGTIALITGIYDRLITAFTSASPALVRRVLSDVVNDPADLKTVFREVDGAFLLALGAGIATAILTVTRVLDIALESMPVLTYGFFFGLIGASAAVLRDELVLNTRGRVAAVVAGGVVAFVASGTASAALGTSVAATFFAGAVAVSAMILPGISGSLLLVILGQYERMTSALSAFVDALLATLTGGPTATVIETGVPVVAFLAGGVVGLLTVAHTVRAALEARREATLAFLVGLIVGALRAPVVRVGEEVGGWSLAIGGEFAVAAVVGALLVVGVERAAGGIDID